MNQQPEPNLDILQFPTDFLLLLVCNIYFQSGHQDYHPTLAGSLPSSILAQFTIQQIELSLPVMTKDFRDA